MVERGVIVEVGGGGEMVMASSSTSTTALPKEALSSGYFLYPPPLATYELVVASPKKFMETLEKLHAAMGSKFKIPIVGGQELDLHRLFVEVTYRGGLAKVLQDKKWKDVTGAFSFPSSATNASFILRKYYYSLLVHYEQIYFFRAVGWNHETINALQSSSRVPAPPHRSKEMPSSTNTQAAESREFGVNAVKSLPEGCAALAGSSVHGVIDGKFDSGYLITVKIGSEELKGVLYQSTADGLAQQEEQHSSSQQCHNIPVDNNNNSNPASTSVVVRRKRRKKSEIRKRDPAHPKPNRSGYNFFFAEQHARLKLIYPGKDREISRMIGDSWNKLNEAEKSVYQEKAARDKERYKMEMEGYRERLKTGNNTIDYSVSVQQQLPEPSSINVMDMEKKHESEDAEEAPHAPGIVTSSSMTVRSYSVPVLEQISNEAQLHSVQADNNDKNNLQADRESSQSIPDNETSGSLVDKSNLDESTSRILPADRIPVQSHQHYTDLNMNKIDLEKEFQTDAPNSPTRTENEPCSSSKTHSINLNSSSAMIFKDKIPEEEQQQQQPRESDDNSKTSSDNSDRRSKLEDDDRILVNEHAFQMKNKKKKKGVERRGAKEDRECDERISHSIELAEDINAT